MRATARSRARRSSRSFSEKRSERRATTHWHVKNNVTDDQFVEINGATDMTVGAPEAS
jgi:hypothetical protein